MNITVEIGEYNPYREAALVRLFHPSNPQDQKAIEGLDVASLYAHNPFAMSEENPRRPMTRAELKKFISMGDQNHQTRAIASHKDRTHRVIGFEYYSRTDPDDIARLPHVHAMARDAGMDLTDKTKIFDFNFDLPDRSDYRELGMSAVKQGMEEFFRKNPDAAVVFYFEHDDLKNDRDDYNIMVSLGGTDIGNINYEKPGEVPTDHLLYLDKSHFEHRVRKSAKMPRNYAATSLPTLHTLEQSANVMK